MTLAVCLKCGAFKRGAWVPCVGCGYTPDDDESYTKHLLVTDHYLSKGELEEVAQQIKAGEKIDFPEDVLKQAWVSKAEIDRANRGCTIGCVTVLLGIIGLSGLLMWAFFL